MAYIEVSHVSKTYGKKEKVEEEKEVREENLVREQFAINSDVGAMGR